MVFRPTRSQRCARCNLMHQAVRYPEPLGYCRPYNGAYHATIDIKTELPFRYHAGYSARPPAGAPAGGDHPANGGIRPGRRAEAGHRPGGWPPVAPDAQGVPAYIVFSDAVLWRMAAAVPKSPTGLLVSGVGPVKLERYGDAFLKLLNEH